MSDLSSLPQMIADAIFNSTGAVGGGNLVAGQIFLSVIILVMLLLPVMLIISRAQREVNNAGSIYLIIIVLILAMETAIGWLDAYIFMTVIFLVAVSFSAWFYYGRPTGG